MESLLSVESYHLAGGGIERAVQTRVGDVATSRITAPTVQSDGDLAAVFDRHWLRSTVRPAPLDSRGTVKVIDVFAGCGGLTLGVAEACRALRLEMQPLLAIDTDTDALGVYGRNFPEAQLLGESVEEILAPVGSKKPTSEERALQETLGEVDLIIGGPPCQGHSNLNNHTRWHDPKNELYMSMARFCEVFRPRNVVIENVPGVERDASRVAQRTWAKLQDLGYAVDSGILDASRLGVAQTRRRSVTLASLDIRPDVASAQAEVETPIRSTAWAIGDLLRNSRSDPFNSPPKSSPENIARMNYLFEHNLHDLPNEFRPDCHKLKPHSYTPMYGRMFWDRPSATITTGFGSMGRGRFVHPREARLITPHEAARLQGFPDFFDFGGARRTLLHKLIGNAVPPKLGYAVGLHLLR